MNVPKRLVGALAACAAATALSPGAASAAGGAEQASSPVQLTTLGSMTWGFYDGAVPKQFPNETAQVTSAMNQAINDYNTVASYSKYVPVTYNAGIPTAQANYDGSVGFGGLRQASTAQHELSHFMGAQPHVDGGKGSWGSKCASGWANTIALSRMRAYYGRADVGIGCSNSVGHFWDYGLNYQQEWNWLSKGRNVGIMGAMRADVGLPDGSSFPTANYRLVSRSVGQVAADANLTEGGSLISAPSTVAAQQTWSLSAVNGFVRLRNAASGRFLSGATVVGTANPGAAQTWEIAPSTDGYFQLRNEASNQCLRVPGADATLTVASCDTNADNPDRALQWHLATAPAVPAPTPTPAATVKALVGVGSGRCLDIPASGAPAPISTVLWDCNGNSVQRWTWTAKKELRTPDGKCLDAWNLGRTNGTTVTTWSCNGGAHQQWDINADGTVVNVNSKLCLDAENFGTTNRTRVFLWTCLGNSNQRWVLRS